MATDFKKIYAENKVAVIGVPIIVLILLLQKFVLEPSRATKKPATTPTAAAPLTPAAGTPAAGGAPPAADVPAPTPVIMIPPLSQALQNRMHPPEEYPFPTSRNCFVTFVKTRTTELAVAPTIELASEPELLARPEVSYHGYFNVGRDRVAILKLAGVMQLKRVQQMLDETPFSLAEITDDHVVLADTTSPGDDLVVALSEKGAAENTTPPGSPRR